MLASVTRQISLDRIQIHKINVVTPITKQIILYRDIANQSPKTLPVIHLGRISDKLYALSDFDVLFGAKESKLTEVTTEIIDFKNDVDFIIEHVKLNKNPSGFNQFSLFKVIDYLDSQKISKDKALGLLQIYQTTTNKLLDLELHQNVIKELSKLNDFLSEKLTTFTIPYYIPEFISRFKIQTQSDNVKKVIDMIQAQVISDYKFTWPSIEEIKIILHKPEEHKSAVVELSTVKSSPKQKKISNDIVKISKNVICIPGNKHHPTYHINKKTDTVSIVNDKGKIISLDETKSQKVYLIPSKVVEFLELEETKKPKKIKTFSNSSTIISYLKKNPDAQGVMFLK